MASKEDNERITGAAHNSEHAIYQSDAATFKIKFFEISPLSFNPRFGSLKLKEDAILKIPSGTILPICCITPCLMRMRWLVLKDTFLVYLKSNYRSFKSDQGREDEEVESSKMVRYWRLGRVILIDNNFAFKTIDHRWNKQHLLKIYNSHGRMAAICHSIKSLREWNKALHQILTTDAARSYFERNRFGSFAPERYGNHVSIFIDGANHMEAVAKAIDRARLEVFITDWCMNPEIFLRRPVHDNTWRLDKLLERKAVSWCKN